MLIVYLETIGAITVRRPLKRQRERKKVAVPGIEPRASGLSRQCSATELRHPPTAIPLSFPFIALLLSDCREVYWMIACVQLLIIMNGEHNHGQWTGLPHSAKTDTYD